MRRGRQEVPSIDVDNVDSDDVLLGSTGSNVGMSSGGASEFDVEIVREGKKRLGRSAGQWV
jgi:hypothetical protein